MLCGHGQRLPADHGTAINTAERRPVGQSPAYAAWRTLTPERRLAAIERRLNPANDLSDGYPPAL